MSQDRETALSSTIALAALYSSCVEAFALIHPKHLFERREQLLLTKLGIQQARLLAWGSIVGISAPPAWVATHMVPVHPSATNPEPHQAVYFGERDARLDEETTREQIHDALTDIIRRAENLSREQMMHDYGMKPSRKGTNEQPALDASRLDGFHEKYALLLDLAHVMSVRSPRRNSVVAHSWTVSNVDLFSNFVEMIRYKIDEIIHIMEVEDRVDRAVKLDIKALGWHPVVDEGQTARCMSKLKIIQDACNDLYPDYAWATLQAMDNIQNKWKGSHGYDDPPHRPTTPQQPLVVQATSTPGKRHSVFSIFHHKSSKKGEATKSPGGIVVDETPRSKSDAGFSIASKESPVRSKSVSHVSTAPSEARQPANDQCNHGPGAETHGLDELERLNTLASQVSRQDQWRP